MPEFAITVKHHYTQVDTLSITAPTLEAAVKVATHDSDPYKDHYDPVWETTEILDIKKDTDPCPTSS